MAIRVLASDLDGTLLNEESKISVETVEAVKAAQDAGIRFVAATGRAWSTAHPIFQEAGIEVDYILLNGAEFRISSGDVIYQETMGRDVAQKAMDVLLAMGMDIEVNTDQGDFSTNTKVCHTALKILDFDQFWNMAPKILKLFAFSDEPATVEKARKSLKGWQEVCVTSSAAWNVEVTAVAAQKGMMMKKAAEFYQVLSDEVMVFGDGENDETMFREFCHSRAVENAVLIVRMLAEKVIESNRKNGVAKEIKQILGGM